MTVTLLSVVFALGIGTYEALDLVADRFGLRSGIGTWLGSLSHHYDTLGFGIIGAFVLAWSVSWLMHRRGRSNRVEPASTEWLADGRGRSPV
ncbi:hypothetical protein [Methylobacterium sp. WL19]|uniref:HoxN/HupN/NixA family nickel/cobalt transporter n=1 Tax=Methylobacterium sp. WL19 TaxID=2603896 RepID=UPI00248477C0|nr:hypothetical protein [Methylobacterium sp. WL19]